MEGQCWLLGGDVPTPLSAGDLVVAMHWPRHALASSPESPLQAFRDFLLSSGSELWAGGTSSRPKVLQVGHEKADVTILTGVFSLKGRGAKILIDQLPDLMHLHVNDEDLAPQLKMVWEFIHYENKAARHGYVAVASRLMDLLFIQILRSAVKHPKVRIGFLAGLADPSISRALTVIHTSPSNCWTVAMLAREACLSRTTFAERFKQMVGVTPIQYVTRWRMIIAEDLLRQTDLTIEHVRDRLGYGSGFVFARAFRAHSGLSPRDYRRSIQSANRARNQGDHVAEL